MSFTKSGNVTDNPLVIGASSTGSAVINGGTDVSRNYINIGRDLGSSGTLTVTGAGSTLTAAGPASMVRIGLAGSGLLNVQSGGALYSYGVVLGTQGGTGALNLTGAGTHAVLSDDDLTNSGGYAGFLTLGASSGGRGTVNISSGATLELRNSTTENAPGIFIGQKLGGTGVMTVDGAGTEVNIHQTPGANKYAGGPFLGVGQRGQGTLTVSNNAEINLTGQYGQFRVSRGNDQGEAGAPARLPLSTCSILSGADINVTMTGGNYYGAVVRVGRNFNSNGKLIVSGEGSSLNIHGDNVGSSDFRTTRLEVGREGVGELVLSNGGDVTMDGGNDQMPMLSIGDLNGGVGTATLSGAGTTLTILSSNTTGQGGFVAVARSPGAAGTLSISDGAQLINCAGAANAFMAIGGSGAYNGAPASDGKVIVDGKGNTATLLDAGTLLMVGASWIGDPAVIASVGFTEGGKGSLSILNGATVRADETGVGVGGRIGGNGTLDGNLTVDGGGTILDGSKPGQFTVTGNLALGTATLAVDVKSLTAGTGYDQIKVGGATTLGGRGDTLTLAITTDSTFNFAAGDRLKLIDGVGSLDLDIRTTAKATITGEPSGLAFMVSDEGSDLFFTALNSGSGAAKLDFGQSSTTGAKATIKSGDGSGSGGLFDTLYFQNVSEIDGTAAKDVFTIKGGAASTLLGFGGGDTLKGGLGADKLDGGAGDDTILGSSGNDRIVGGAGTDKLTGGAGNDTFIFALIGDSGKGTARDVITDFIQGSDRIDLSAIDPVPATAADDAFALTGNKGLDAFAVGVKGQLRYDIVNGDTIIQLDANGDGKADAEIQLTGAITLAGTDFVL